MKKKEVKEEVQAEVKPEIIQEVKGSKLCICGCSESKVEAPFNDETWEIWGMNNLYGYIPRWTRWFEIHPIGFDGQHYTRRGQLDFRGLPVDKYLQAIGKMKCPVYLQKPYPEVMPNGVLYPLDLILNMFKRRYFTNSVSYMIALGIYEYIVSGKTKFKEMSIVGVDMAVDTEYFWQRPSCEYFVGIAEGLGIKVTMPDTCDLLKTRFLYGFEEHKSDAWKTKLNGMIQSMEQRKNKAIDEKMIAMKKEQQYIGAISAAKEIDKVWK